MKIQWDFNEFYKFAVNLTNVSKFESHMKNATKEIAKVLLEKIKGLTPVEDGNLIAGWEGNKFLVEEVDGGFEVKIVNTTEYAPWVNDGHMAYNQYGGPYPIKKRIKVTTPYQWQKGSERWYVFGHFFVERGILQLNDTKQVEDIIYAELEKWWRGV